MNVKKLFTRICFILCLLVIGDFALGKILDFMRDHAPDGRYYKARYTLEMCKEDIVIIGDSRGETNYVPSVIEDSLHTTCWNASRGGQGIPFFRCMQEGILARYAPKLAIINLEPYMLENELGRVYEIAGFLRPFYSSHEEIRPILNRISPFEKYLLTSRLYAYNSSFYYLLRPYLIRGLDGRREDKGWKPREGKLDSRLVKDLERVTYDEPLNPEAVAEFNTMVKKFKEMGSEVMVVISPDYARIQEQSPTIDYLKQFSAANQVPVILFSKDTSIVTHDEFFKDPDHLNEEGAVVFTKKLASAIKRYYNFIGSDGAVGIGQGNSLQVSSRQQAGKQ